MSDSLRDEITRTAYELYEKSGRDEGNDLLNWLAAEKKVYFNRMILSWTQGNALALLEYKPIAKEKRKQSSQRIPKSHNPEWRENKISAVEEQPTP